MCDNGGYGDSVGDNTVVPIVLSQEFETSERDRRRVQQLPKDKRTCRWSLIH